MYVVSSISFGFILLSAVLVLPGWKLLAKPLEISPSFQADSILSISEQDSSNGWLIRLLPQLDASQSINDYTVDSSLIASISAQQFQAFDESINTSYKLHRGWLRLRSESHELRIGLQKINFGTAKVLRSLQWFDQIDPLDPLSFTPGVQGALWRYYTENSGNIWIWSLLNNRQPMGDFRLMSEKDQFEYGGRVQLSPAWYEAAFSYHQRQIGLNESTNVVKKSVYEQRFGFDAVLDLVIGFWVEASLSVYSQENFFAKSYLNTTIGGDYTFPIGNGLYTNIELMAKEAEVFDKVNDSYFISFSQSYPISFHETARIYSISCIDCKYSTTSLDYQRTFDKFFYTVSLFHTKGLSELAADSGGILPKPIRDGFRFDISFQINI